FRCFDGIGDLRHPLGGCLSRLLSTVSATSDIPSVGACPACFRRYRRPLTSPRRLPRRCEHGTTATSPTGRVLRLRRRRHPRTSPADAAASGPRHAVHRLQAVPLAHREVVLDEPV